MQSGPAKEDSDAEQAPVAAQAVHAKPSKKKRKGRKGAADEAQPAATPEVEEEDLDKILSELNIEEVLSFYPCM